MRSSKTVYVVRHVEKVSAAMHGCIQLLDGADGFACFLLRKVTRRDNFSR
jgi:hypothetical protein